MSDGVATRLVDGSGSPQKADALPPQIPPAGAEDGSGTLGPRAPNAPSVLLDAAYQSRAAAPMAVPRTSLRARRFWELDTGEALLALGELLLEPLPLTRVEGTLYRAVLNRYLRRPVGAAPEWAPQPLFANGSLQGARYTPRTPADELDPPAGLYVAMDPTTPPTELQQVIYAEDGTRITRPLPPYVMLSMEASVERMLDLTDAETCRRLDLTDAELHCDWQTQEREYLRGHGPMPPTQLLGLAAYHAGLFAGLCYPAARTQLPATNAVIFPTRLVSDGPRPDRIVVEDPDDEYADYGRLPMPAVPRRPSWLA
jgi:hypothetical protein